MAETNVTQFIGRGGKVDVNGLNPKDAKFVLEETNKILCNKIACSILQDKEALGKFIAVLKDARKSLLNMGDEVEEKQAKMKYSCFDKLGEVVAKMKRPGTKLSSKEITTLKHAMETLMRAFYLDDVDSYVAANAKPTAKKIIDEIEQVELRLMKISPDLHDDFRSVSKALQ